jgi:hypothetical protein
VLFRETAYRSEKPLYITLELGNGRDRFVTAVMDEPKGTGKGYDTIRLDANNNNDLTDDPPVNVKAKAQGRGTTLSVPSVPVTVRYHDGAERRLRLKLEVTGHRYSSGNRIYWRVSAELKDHLEGKLAVGSRTGVRLAVYDSARGTSSPNGCFDDFGVDRMRIDLDGDGVLKAPAEESPLSRVVSFGGKLWELRTDSAGRRVDLSPCSIPSGELEIRAKFSSKQTPEQGRIELHSNSGFSFAVDGAAGKAPRVPAARYRVSACTLELRDKKSAKWKAECSFPKPVDVEARGKTTRVIGLPLKVEPVVTGPCKLGGRLRVEHRIVGAGGEVYGSISPGRRMPPKVRVVDAEGIEVSGGKMEYG